MQIFGVPVMEIVTLGATAVGVLYGYFRIQEQTKDNGEKIEALKKNLENQNYTNNQSLAVLKDDLRQKLHDLSNNIMRQQSEDRELRKDQDRRISVLEAQSRTQESAMSGAISTLSDIKNNVQKLDTRLDQIIMHQYNKGQLKE